MKFVMQDIFMQTFTLVIFCKMEALVRACNHISRTGISKKNDENDTEGNIYGVMPYVAPEVLSG